MNVFTVLNVKAFLISRGKTLHTHTHTHTHTLTHTHTCTNKLAHHYSNTHFIKAPTELNGKSYNGSGECLIDENRLRMK